MAKYKKQICIRNRFVYDLKDMYMILNRFVYDTRNRFVCDIKKDL